MLEIKNLCKTYKSKGGVVVKALDDVSIKFPERGMVFLLGKSGSGKSTLLNVIGGLDKPDSGEIIIKGRNSNTFSGADFDSYRNTFIGFIFQEYNILNEFNIEQNISLALQLQGKKNDKQAVDSILEAVDLKGYGKRKPNTLSGGQKQRIAIARALIKSPEIIMADEPTGALDSNTGKQVFDTLKKLSQEKLVIVVSHDRDFAEIYGDRIIELADGKVISDVTKETKEPEAIGSNVTKLNENLISIKSGKDVTDEDIKALYDIIKSQEGEVVITSGDKTISSVKQTMHIRGDNKSEVFENTKEIHTKEYDPKQTKFIRSRLPFARALKMGASSLKTKPIRMIFTVFLTLVSLVMFGVASTLLFYDQNYSIATGLENSTHTFERIEKKYDFERFYKQYDEQLQLSYESSYKSDNSTYMSDEDINKLNQNHVNHNYAGIYGEDSITISSLETTNYYITKSFTGILDAGEGYLESIGIHKVEGSYPDSSSKIAISTYMADALIQSSLLNFDSYADMIDKTINVIINTNNGGSTRNLIISGVYDCGPVSTNYDKLKDSSTNYSEMVYEFQDYIKNSYQTLCFVSKSFYEDYDFSPYSQTMYELNSFVSDAEISRESMLTNIDMGFVPVELLDYVKNDLQFIDIDGNPIEYKGVSNNQVYLPFVEYQNFQEQKKSLLVNRVANMLYLSKLTDELASYLSIDENKQALSSIVDNINAYGMYSYPGDYTSDMAKLMEFYDTYYKKFIIQKYTITKGVAVLNELENEGKTSVVDEWYNFRNECYDYINGNTYSDAVYQYLKGKLDTISDYEKYLKNSEARLIATLFLHEYSVYPDETIPFTKTELDTYYELMNRAANNVLDLTENEIDIVRDLAISKNRPDLFMTTDLELRDFGFNTLGLEELTINMGKYYLNTSTTSVELQVLGFYISTGLNRPILSFEFIKKYGEVTYTGLSYITTSYTQTGEAKYSTAITMTNYSQAQIADLLQHHDGYRYQMTNATYQQLSFLVDTIQLLQKVFLITGIVFAVSASLMLFNFISSSIASKTKDIGILRAVGARGSDLFKIFFSESGIVAIICFTLAIIASIFVCMWMNNSLAQGLGFKLLNFSYLNAGIIILGSIVIAFIGTFIPVLIASKKAPIDSIRTL